MSNFTKLHLTHEIFRNFTCIITNCEIWHSFSWTSIRNFLWYFPAVNLEELIDRRQSLVAGYCQGAVVILTDNKLVISYSPVSKLALGPACSTLPDGPWKTRTKLIISHFTTVFFTTYVVQWITFLETMNWIKCFVSYCRRLMDLLINLQKKKNPFFEFFSAICNFNII